MCECAACVRACVRVRVSVRECASVSVCVRVCVSAFALCLSASVADKAAIALWNDVQLKWNSPDIEGLVDFMCKKHGFE